MTLAAQRAWTNRTATRRCFEPLISSCLVRWQGATDGPALPKTGPYYFRPPWTTRTPEGRSTELKDAPCV